MSKIIFPSIQTTIYPTLTANKPVLIIAVSENSGISTKIIPLIKGCLLLMCNIYACDILMHEYTREVYAYCALCRFIM